MNERLPAIRKGRPAHRSPSFPVSVDGKKAEKDTLSFRTIRTVFGSYAESNYRIRKTLSCS